MITAVIKTFERPNHLKRLLRSIRQYAPEIEDIVIADDSKYPVDIQDAFVISLPYDSGASFGRNSAVSVVRTRYTLMLDDDFVFTEKTDISGMLDYLEKGGFDIVGGRVDGIPEERSCCSIKFEGGFIVLEGPVYSGCEYVLDFFIARTDLFKEVLWDETLKNGVGGEHICFFLDCKKAGKKIGYFRDSIVRHFKSGNSFNSQQEFIEYTHLSNRRYGNKKLLLERRGYKDVLFRVNPGASRG